MFPEFPKNMPKVVHSGEKGGDIPNIPLWHTPVTLFQFILNFTNWKHHNPTSWEISRNISNVLCQNTIGTLFGIFLNVPNNFLIGKPQSHHLGHHKSIPSFPWWGNCKETSWEYSECTCNILGGYLAGTLSISLQCICDVPGGNTTPHPQC